MHPNDTTLNDYVDGSLGPVERQSVDQHLAGCAACRQTVEDLREILDASKALELREPPVRAWSRIERAIKLESNNDVARRLQPSGATAGPAKAGHYRVYVAWLAAAAALVLATVVGMRYTPPASPSDTAHPAAAPAGAVASSDPAQSIEAELRQAESHYENAIKGLEAIANSEQASSIRGPRRRCRRTSP